MTALLVSTWIYIRREHRYSGEGPSHSAVYFPSRGRARWVGGDGVGHCHDVANLPRKSFYFDFVFFSEKTFLFFFFLKSFLCLCTAEYAGDPRGARDAYSVDTLGGHYGRKAGENCKTTFSPLFGRFFLVSKRSCFFLV